MASRKIMFVSHDASRSGAPMVLLNFMRWLRESGTGAEMAIVFIGGGPLMEQFRQLAQVQILDRRRGTGTPQLPFRPDVVYCNSIAGALLGPTLPAGLCPSICHVHELEYAIQTLTWPTRFPNLLVRFDRVIACSDAVRQSLMKNRGVPAERIDLIHEFIRSDQIESCGAEEHREKLRQDLKLPADALVVGCVAAFEWRKGTDVFIQLAHRVRRQSPQLPVHFIWIGGATASHDAFQIDHDVSRLPALKGRLHFVGPQSDPLPLVAGLDLFVLPSREDPFPLVCLEAAACGKPIVCFDQAGGMPEFVQNDAGVVVPYLDIEAMADAVIKLLNDPPSRAAMGEVGRQRVRRQHDVSVAGPLLLRSIERAILGPSLAP